MLGAAVIAMGLLAGLFYAFAIAVMPALTAADDRTLVDAMQQMIDKIENPFFFLTLLGAPALAAVALVQARRSGSPKIAGWIVAGLALYTVMVVVTFAVHFPLNEDLKQAGDPARIENLAAVRDDFVTPWVAWNIVRTLASTAAFGCPRLGARPARTHGASGAATTDRGFSARLIPLAGIEGGVQALDR